jgi:hypothetical protein
MKSSDEIEKETVDSVPATIIVFPIHIVGQSSPLTLISISL